MEVAVIGLGYVGLVTAACLAEWGHRVVGVDVDLSRLAALDAGHLPFYEPQLDELVDLNRQNGRLAFTSVPGDAVAGASMILVAVGTHDGNGGWQTDTIRSCLSLVVPEIDDASCLVIRSTLPPEFIRELPSLISAIRADAGRGPIPVLVNPEFTREGSAVHDFMQPERVVFGSVADPDGRGLAMLEELYASTPAPKLQLSATDAAFSKLGSNLFLATKISFANELAALCEAYGADIESVVHAMSYDSRIGGRFLRAGAGFGGSCLPHQVKMTVRTAQMAGIRSPLLQAVDEVNHAQRERVVEKLRSLLDGTLSSRRVALLGVAFKPHTDDVRDAPSLTIAARLIALGAEVVAYDPMTRAMARAADAVPGLGLASTITEALSGADGVALITEWPEFAAYDWTQARELMRGRAVVDARNFLPATALTNAGLSYVGFGRANVEIQPDAEQRAEPVSLLVAGIAADTVGGNGHRPRAVARQRPARGRREPDLRPTAGTSDHAIDA